MLEVAGVALTTTWSGTLGGVDSVDDIDVDIIEEALDEAEDDDDDDSESGPADFFLNNDS